MCSNSSSLLVDTTTKGKRISKENYTLQSDTMSNDNERVIARGNRKSQPAKVWSINTKIPCRFEKIINLYTYRPLRDRSLYGLSGGKKETDF